MKKSRISFKNICLAILLFVASFCLPLFSAKAPSANTALADQNTDAMLNNAGTILENVNISQDSNIIGSAGYNIRKRDFQEITFHGVSYLALYTNKSVTITSTIVQSADPFNQNLYSISAGALDSPSKEYIVENNVANRESKYLYTRENDDTNYAVFKVDQTKEVVTSIFISIRINGVDTSFSFILVQTPLNLEKNQMEWTYPVSYGNQSIAEPSNGYTYPPLTLTIPNGTELNPVYVKFIYCGESYEVYNINGAYYNNLSEQKEKLDFEKLYFDVSGTYEVEIYDRTYLTNYQGNNHKKFDFKVLNSESPLKTFYFNAYLDNGDILMNNQYTDKTTYVEFVNMSNIRVQNITIFKSYNRADTPEETTAYTPSQIENGILKFEDTGFYRIRVSIAVGSRVVTKEFAFAIFKEIRNNLIIDGKRYETNKINTPEEKDVTCTVETSYNGSTCQLNSKYTYTFKIVVARSEPSITGIGDNERTSDDVVLTVHGVGNIEVTISHNGSTQKVTLQNGKSLQAFSESGKYYVSMVDEMGRTAVKSFTINIKLNGAAMTLIIIGSVILVLALVLIVISRLRVKVR